MIHVCACGPRDLDVSDRVPGDDDPHATGLLPPTPEDIQWMIDHAVDPADIRPNRLALERIRTARLVRGLVPLPDARVDAAWRQQRWSGDPPPPLPVAVDNSTLAAFPPIRSQGSQGSCGSFSTTYYQLTHTVALARGWDAKNGGDSYRFSPKWTYNLVNGGDDGGSTSMAPFGVIQRLGAATWAQFPYSGASVPTNYRPWCMDTATWRSALQYRTDQTGSVTGMDRIDGLQAAKQLLTNGSVLHITTYINSWQFLSGGIKDNPSSAADDPYLGQAVCHWRQGSNGAHGMTVVGYNDAIWVDVNQDDIIDDGELGALKIANSWGTGWRNGGFAWIAYDALRDISRVPGAPGSNRVGAFDDAKWMTVRPGYQPVMTAECTVEHLKRDQLLLALGVGATTDTEPTWQFYPLTYEGGPYAFDGTTTAVPHTFVFDFTDIADPDGQARRYFLHVRDRTAGDPAELFDFMVTDELNATDAVSANAAFNVDDDFAYAWVDFTFDFTNTPPDISAIPDQVITVNGDTGPVPFTVDDAETPAGDLTLRAISSNTALVVVPDIVFGGSDSARTVTVTPRPYQTGSAPVTVWLSDGAAAGETTFTVHVTATENTPPTVSDIPDQTTQAGIATAPIAFSIGDAESSPDDLEITVQGSVLEPEVTGSGANRTLRVCPYPDTEGEVEITVRVSDGELTAATSFMLEVTAGPANTAPTISSIADQVTDAGVPTAPAAFTVGDAESDPVFLQLMYDTDNWNLVRFSGVRFGGSGADRTISICPNGGEHGTATITVRVWDGQLEAQTQFLLTVHDTGNTPPVISPIPDQIIPLNGSSGPIAFTVTDAETPPEYFELTRTCDNWDLIPWNGLLFGGAGQDRTISVTPWLGEHGTATITVKVTDGALEATEEFSVTVDPSLLCGNGWLDTGETCDPPDTCPSSCNDGDPCTSDGLTGSPATCDAACDFDPITACTNGDGCCPAGCHATNDDDCTPVCGNGVVEPGETCDPPDSCPDSCDDADPCTADGMTGSVGDCDVACSHEPVTACADGDGCCPAGCNANTDSDCTPVCGNDVIEPGETCDPPDSCPDSCDDADPCTADGMTGDPQNCDAVCHNDPITSCDDADGCCPTGCDSTIDTDCPVVCGNGVLEPGETCDPPDTCPASCDDGNACTVDSLAGAAQDCDAACSHDPITDCAGGDGCCPAGCDSGNDDDCSPTCGNGVIDPGETCDPPDTCPASCDDADSCTRDTLTGSAQNCNVACSHASITSCNNGDGCCPAGCHSGTDDDCPPGCGNGEIDPGETCDPPATCPSSCDDGDPCTSDTLTGTPQQCNAACSHDPITACGGGDGCCPEGCDGTNDGDCGTECGNAVIEEGERCDPPDTCPDSCDDADACTIDTLEGSAADCNAFCRHDPVTGCSSDDGCCPAGCGPAEDDDCPADQSPGNRIQGSCGCGGTRPAGPDPVALTALLLLLVLVRRRR